MNIAAANLALYLMPQPQGDGFDFTRLFPAGGGATASAYGVGNVGVALKNAETNEAQQLKQVAADPQIQRELAHYEKVLSKAKTFEDVLDDPIARKVLMKANGLGDQVAYVGLAKKAMMSDPKDPNSVAAKLGQVNGRWLEFAQKFNIPEFGLDRLYPQQDGFAGRWRVTIERDDKPKEAVLEITKVRGGWQGKLDGVVVPVEIKDGLLKTSYIWDDKNDGIVLTRLEGKLTRDGALLGDQIDDGVLIGKWNATPYNAGAVKAVSDDYIAESRLDLLDQQLPGLGSAVLFKKVAASLDSPIKILGSALGREIITTAFGIPKQIALQSFHAQEKAILQRLDPAKLKNAAFVETVVQRYLIQLNGGTAGLSV